MNEQLTGIIQDILQGLQGKIEPQRLVRSARGCRGTPMLAATWIY